MRTIAIHLPQFHPIPENDAWWGKGFTEWTNVTKARPVVPGHTQPHLPADLGFYDLRLPEARLAQAELARQYGIDAFCYYHYWFTGKQVLERPVREIVASGQPDFPFCLCWANENWTRAWDGRSNQALLEQHYSDADDEAHIRHLLPILADARYLRVGGRPVLLVYRTELLPQPQRTAETWRREAARAGLGDLYLMRVESFRSDVNPTEIGFDAAMEFAPDWRQVRARQHGRLHRIAARLGLYPRGYLEHRFAEYDDLVADMLAKPQPGFRRHRCVTPGFDNSARRKKDATIFVNGTPQAYGRWLEQVLQAEAALQCPADEKLVFVNAWNEWAEGNHLEPCQRWGRAYLEAHAEARRRAGV
ncbi:MAG: glycoside hydrolase family 99-like domain-containing protein [Burkholderiaceae bacterium]|nr:glycoside hydrolase family 99-like domain-containing protein [Burkholderiaceae bacterium]